MGTLAKSQTLELVGRSFWNQAPAVLPYSVQTFEVKKLSVRYDPRM